MTSGALRKIYRSFFWVTGFSYLIFAVGSYRNDNLDSLWPGGSWWAFLYIVAGFGAIVAGVAANHKLPHGRYRVLRVTGLLLTPALLILRATVNLWTLGFENGLLGSAFLIWTAFTMVWAVVLVWALPTHQDDWDRLYDEYTNIRVSLRKDKDDSI